MSREESESRERDCAENVAPLEGGDEKHQVSLEGGQAEEAEIESLEDRAKRLEAEAERKSGAVFA